MIWLNMLPMLHYSIVLHNPWQLGIILGVSEYWISNHHFFLMISVFLKLLYVRLLSSLSKIFMIYLLVDRHQRHCVRSSGIKDTQDLGAWGWMPWRPLVWYMKKETVHRPSLSLYMVQGLIYLILFKQWLHNSHVVWIFKDNATPFCWIIILLLTMIFGSRR